MTLFPQSWDEAKIDRDTEITEYVFFNMICKTGVSSAVIQDNFIVLS